MPNSTFTSPFIAVVGLSLGDEGKGKVGLDAAVETQIQGNRPAVAVVKINGGANSGHTVNGLKHNLIPAGITDDRIKYLAVSSGVVADPLKLVWEMSPLINSGLNLSCDRLKIDNRTMISHLMDRILDGAQEAWRIKLGEAARGSTMRGISPAYARETMMLRIDFQDFFGSFEAFRNKIAIHIDLCCSQARHVYRLSPDEWFGILEGLYNAERRANAASIDAGLFSDTDYDFRKFSPAPFELDVPGICDLYWNTGQKLRGHICSVRELVRECAQNGGSVLGEFGQAALLDKRYGYSPNVTASHTLPFEMFPALGINPANHSIHVIGVAKAYETAVGTHYVPTLMEHEHPLFPILSNMEFGTTTGRQRMVGWANAVLIGNSIRYAGCNDLALNKLDALTYSDDWKHPLKICMAMEDRNGAMQFLLPDSAKEYSEYRPRYVEVPGWREKINGVRSFQDLPQNAINYVVTWYASSVISSGKGRAPDIRELPRLRYIGTGALPGQYIGDAPSGYDLMTMAQVSGILRSLGSD